MSTQTLMESDMADQRVRRLRRAVAKALYRHDRADWSEDSIIISAGDIDELTADAALAYFAPEIRP